MEKDTVLDRLALGAMTVRSLAPPAIVMADLYSLVVEDYRHNERKSVRNLISAWTKHLGPVFGSHPAGNYDPELVAAYIRDRLQDGAKNATVNRELALLRRSGSLALEQLKTEDEKLISSLMRWSKIKALVERNARKGFLKDSEYQALARETREIGIWLAAAFEIAYQFGWRRSELFSMKVAQLNLEDRTISLEDSKNGDPRTVEMTTRIHDLLQECVTGKRSQDFVFTREVDAAGRKPKHGGRIVDFRDVWETACERAGVPWLLFHDLRRTGARNLRRRGVSENVAMRITGHKTNSIFKRYDIIDRTDVQEAVQKLEEAATQSRAGAPVDQVARIQEGFRAASEFLTRAVQSGLLQSTEPIPVQLVFDSRVRSGGALAIEVFVKRIG